MTNYIKNDAGLLVPFAPAILKRGYIEAGIDDHIGLSGEYRLQVRRADGSLKKDTGWFKNLILDAGLNRIGTGGIIGGCALGTNSTAPSATQTALVARAAWTTTNQASSNMQAQAAAPYYFTTSRTYRFAVGALNGNYTEVGVGWTQDNMFSRALIVDSGGNPTPITVLSDESLDVTYRLRIYPQSTDWGGTYTISGTSYTVTGRTASVTSNITTGDAFNSVWLPVDASASNASALAGSLGAITSTPTGSNFNVEASSNIVNAAYSNNSLSRSTTVTWGLNFGNAPGGIKSVLFTGSTIPRTQYEFTPVIPKNNTRTFAMTVSCTWGRRP